MPTTFQNQITEKIFTKGDRRTSIADTLVGANGVAVNLAGHTVAFRMTNADTDVVKVNNATATIDTAASGEVSYPWAALDVDTAAEYWYWWIVTRTVDSKVEHFPGDGKRAKVIFVESF